MLKIKFVLHNDEKPQSGLIRKTKEKEEAEAVTAGEGSGETKGFFLCVCVGV